MKPPTILVLGAHGMLGHTIYRYLYSRYPQSTWGTVKRNDGELMLFEFNAHSLKTLEGISKNIGKVDYIINCIGILQNNEDKKEMKYINAQFPQKLALSLNSNNAKLIHVSTDAVFAPNESNLTEESKPSPADYYGTTKLQGEPLSTSAISIRTSLIGFDPYGHKGLLEWALQPSKFPLNGYSNQLWSGCTTLQFATLCEQIITNNFFQKMRLASPVFHFAPFIEISKHDIIATILTLMKNKNTVTKKLAEPISRSLKTKYPHLLFLNHMENTLKSALQNLISFEKLVK